MVPTILEYVFCHNLKIPAAGPLVLWDLSCRLAEHAKRSGNLLALVTRHGAKYVLDLVPASLCHLSDQPPAAITEIKAHLAPVSTLSAARYQPFADKSVAESGCRRRVDAERVGKVDGALCTPRS